MKRLVLGILVAMSTTWAMAGDWDFGGSYESDRHNFGIELGIGGTGDLSVDLGIRWQMTLHENIAWDVITLKAVADVENNFSESITPELMTGIRLISPDFAGLTAYANGRLGYAYNIDADDGGFAYELGAGINVTRNIYLGYVYNGFKIGDGKVNYHALRIGFLL